MKTGVDEEEPGIGRSCVTGPGKSNSHCVLRCPSWLMMGALWMVVVYLDMVEKCLRRDRSNECQMEAVVGKGEG